MPIENLIKQVEDLVFKIGQQASHKDLHTDALSLLKTAYGLEHQQTTKDGSAREACTAEELAQIQKAERKLRIWANNQASWPAKIINVYSELKKDRGTSLDKEHMARFFEKMNCDPIAFGRNFDQMKNFGEKNHAKIFDVKPNGEITIWPPVEKYVKAYYEECFGEWDNLMKQAYPSYKRVL